MDKGSNDSCRPKGTVCVTGASGFFASWLVRRLLLAGYEVKGTVRDPEDEKKVAHLWKLEGASERLRLVKADLLDEGGFDDAFLGCQGVFHTACPVLPVKSDPKAEIMDPAVKGTLNVLRSCKKNPFLKRVVLTSSSSTVRILGEGDFPAATPLDETFWSSDHLCRKLQLWYPLAKMLAEKEAWRFAELNKIDLVTVVPSFIVGPNLPHNLSHTTSSVLRLLQGRSEVFENHGRMGYVHVDDVATCHVLVYENPHAQGRYICSSSVLDCHQLTNILSGVYPSLSIPKSSPSNAPVYKFNTSKAAADLGIKFKGVEEMFGDCINSLKEQGWIN